MIEEWIRAFSDFTSTIDGWIDDVRGHLAAALGIEDPIKILPYRGYGSPGSITVKGRILKLFATALSTKTTVCGATRPTQLYLTNAHSAIKDEGVKLREENAPLWENLWNMFKRFATDEVEGARIQAELGDVRQEAVTNEEGFFETELRWFPESASTHLWFPVKLNLLHPDKDDLEEDPAIQQSEVMIVRDTANFGVISDIDDTIVHTAATDLLKMIQIAYLGNARSRRPFPGVAEFYRALQGGKSTADNNPIFYVSSSAWNMYDVFESFMDLNHIPKGPILLRDAELALDNLLLFEHETHKLELIQPIFERFPYLPFLLIGDSDQKDAEIYRQLAKRHPGRIWAILIRNVLPNDAERQQQLASIQAEVEASGSQFMTFQETEEAEAFVRNQGWIKHSR